MPTLVYKKNVLSGSSIGLAKEFNSTNSELKAASAKLLDEVKNDLDEVEENLAKELAEQAYIHPTTSGYKHIPAGGKKGNILKWDEDGTAVWEENDIPYYEKHGFLSRNLFDGKNVTVIGSHYDSDTGIVANQITDSRTLFNFKVQAMKGNKLCCVDQTVAIKNSRICITLDTGVETIDYINILHNGIVNDIGIKYPFNYKGIFNVSVNVISDNPSVAGGLVFNDIQIEEGSIMHGYAPYVRSNTEINKKMVEIDETLTDLNESCVKHYYGTSMVYLGFANNSEVPVENLFTLLYNNGFKAGDMIPFAWANNSAAYLTDGTTKIYMCGGSLYITHFKNLLEAYAICVALWIPSHRVDLGIYRIVCHTDGNKVLESNITRFHTEYDIATQSTKGLLSPDDKKKIDGLGTQCTFSLSGTTLTITTN